MSALWTFPFTSSTKVAGPGCRPLSVMLIFNLMFFLIVLNYFIGKLWTKLSLGEITAIFTHSTL